MVLVSPIRKGHKKGDKNRFCINYIKYKFAIIFLHKSALKFWYLREDALLLTNGSSGRKCHGQILTYSIYIDKAESTKLPAGRFYVL